MSAQPTATAQPRQTLYREIIILLALSLGASAIWSVFNFIELLAQPGTLSDQTIAMNRARAAEDLPWLDLARQLTAIAISLAPAALALHFLHSDRGNPFRLLGMDSRRAWFDNLTGVGLAALIGIPGLGLYLVARELGFNTTIQTAALYEHWWTIPVLILLALKNSLLEEIIVVGYLATRLKQLSWSPVAIIVASALLRGFYHLYQGIGGFIGNVVMGAVFAAFYLRYGRIMPLIIAHFILDIVAFVGYALLVDHLSWL
ncbi:CPBP family intramembrane metalloprotease [Natronoglycomyces albus]|uniref:CPBP family intramembrane metalloprotease n=2 Tax=Natronoglycomyces albus TaxID=2811108 RepID=A0A895XTQ7_9ACTN|nr:type II CAAX endopeptidase family protein [Natronoglycomyces albus]QSB05028.1 CPBP family intramembrane metalloprotease [Natronoglycomyces albus]